MHVGWLNQTNGGRAPVIRAGRCLSGQGVVVKGRAQGDEGRAQRPSK